MRMTRTFIEGDRVRVRDLDHLKPLLRNATGTVAEWHHDNLYSVTMDSNVYTGDSRPVEAVLEASEMEAITTTKGELRP